MAEVSFKLFDGAKSVPLESLPEEAWTYLTGGPMDGSKLKKLYKVVPWLFRGVQYRAGAIQSIPFSIYRGDEEIDTSEDWQNEVGFLPDPHELLFLTEGDLCLHGRTFWFKERNAAKTLELRRLYPPSVKVKTDPERGITGYKRVLGPGANTKEFNLKDIAYFKLPNFWGELAYGIPDAEVALGAAGVLLSVDLFAQAYFARGAVKATLLTVDGNPKPQERRRLRAWWRRVVSGVENAFGTDVISSKVTPVIIGEGLESLSEQSLTKEKREDISAALGIPQSILFSTGSVNRSVMEQDDVHFYTKTILPEALMIERQANATVFEPEGFRFKFRHQEMTIFRADEAERSMALSNLTNSGMPLQAGLNVLGFDLDDETKKMIEDELKRKEQDREKMQERLAQRPAAPPPGLAGRTDEGAEQPPQEKSALEVDLDKWERKALKSLRKGAGANVSFDSNNISPSLHGAVVGRLGVAESAIEVRAAFKDARLWEGYP